jgi:hypothetical protein
MKARRFDEILRARGYKAQEQVKYQGTNVYIKQHIYNTLICKVEKDSHGKAQSMSFQMIGGTKTLTGNIEEFKKAEFDREFLVREAIKIHDAFEQLKQLKAPKHLYCF